MADSLATDATLATIESRREIVQGLEETRELLLASGTGSQRALHAVESVLRELRSGEQCAHYLTAEFQNRVTAHFHEAKRRALQKESPSAALSDRNS
jgi:hypothetical protein